MKVLIPVTNQTNVFHDNLFRAPQFAVYSIDNKSSNVYCSLMDVIQNPYSYLFNNDKSLCENHGICDPDNCTLQHLQEHYSLTRNMDSCDYILADHFCETMTKALKEKGINIYKISPFLHKSDIAIKNFLLGVSLASTLQHIHIRT